MKDSKPQTNVVFNPDLIQKKKIKSVTIYAEINENGLKSGPSLSGKQKEIAFDSLGNIIYELKTTSDGFDPFITYGRGTVFEIKSYDSERNLISAYSESRKGTEEEFLKYDDEGHIVQSKVKFKGEPIFQLNFTWKNGKMVASEKIESNENSVLKFDEKGRIIESSGASFKTIWNYKEVGDTLKTTIKTYYNDTLYSTQSKSSIIETDLITEYTKRDSNGKLQLEKKAAYDSQGNAIYYSYYDPVENEYEEEYPPMSYEIKNEYDQDGLLIQRSFYYSRADVGENILTKLERYFYDPNPLIFQLQKGVIHENELEYQEMQNDR